MKKVILLALLFVFAVSFTYAVILKKNVKKSTTKETVKKKDCQRKSTCVYSFQ